LAGGAFLLNYQMIPGSQTPGPAKIVTAKVPKKPKLMLFLHPKCPCSRATVEELDRLHAATAGRFDVNVFFVGPAIAKSSWTESKLVARARTIPGAEIVYDAGGKLAKQYGALTSGQTFVFDTSGKRVFQGGLTASRGHEGDNPGRASLEQYVATGKIAATQTPVFGCAFGTLAKSEGGGE
jgi:hypothetical protein